MGISRLTLNANDASTYLVDYAIKDPDGDAVVPTSLMWSLRNQQGLIINNRLNVVVDNPAATGTITLYGDDLAYINGNRRYLTLYATYSDGLTNDLPITPKF